MKSFNHEGHEEIEGHEDSQYSTKPGIRVASPLSVEAERVMHQTIGCAIAVHLADVHRAQLISYLRTTGLRGGLLINFGVRVLKDGLKRVVL